MLKSKKVLIPLMTVSAVVIAVAIKKRRDS
jgi:hypothetical protein